MMSRLQTRRCVNEDNIRAFFERIAVDYQETHGHPQKLFQYRMRLVARHASLNKQKIFLDVGCGNGHHLFYLSQYIKEGIGIDFASRMIEKAQHVHKQLGGIKHLGFHVDRAQESGSVADH